MLSGFALLFIAAFAQQGPCEALKSLTLTNVTVTQAEFRPAGAPASARGRGGQTLPAHCRVAAVLAPSKDSHIEMELWMPAEGWNGKFLAYGNGGWAGTVSSQDLGTGLLRGYATASNDTGHQSSGGSFALGHPEKLIDFGYRAMHEMAVQSKAIIQAFYKQAPRLSYYQGCSTGGRQGLMEAQRYPDDFDGIIAGAPVYNQTRLHASQMSKFVDMLKEPARILPAEKVTMVAEAVLGACDATDGVKDRLVSDPQMCKFDPSTLICTSGDAANCLTAAQVETARRAYGSTKTKSGELVYPGHSFGFETGWRMPQAGGTPPDLPADSFRYIGRRDPNWNRMSFDLDTDLALALKNGADAIEATDPDLAKFKARDGKLLLYHGWADPGPAPENTINYYNEVVRKLGGKQDDWMRLFLMPGMGHCSGGAGPSQADYLSILEKWREGGTAPNQFVATRPATRGLTLMSRPICSYPQVAKYTGSGSTDDAANFVCAAR